MSKTDAIDEDVRDVPTGPSPEANVVQGYASDCQYYLGAFFGQHSSLPLAKSLGSFLGSLDACNAYAEVVIRPRYGTDPNRHRVTVHYPQHFGLDVGGSVGEEQQSEDD